MTCEPKEPLFVFVFSLLLLSGAKADVACMKIRCPMTTLAISIVWFSSLGVEGPSMTAQTVEGYANYRPVAFLNVDHGSVKAEKVNARLDRIVIEVGPNQARTVTLIARGYRHIRLYDLRSNRRFRANRDRVTLRLPDDGIGWFVLYAPAPAISIYDFQPAPLVNVQAQNPERAKYPVVDVHAHLRRQDASVEERIAVMDATSVAVVVESPMANAGLATGDSYNQFERHQPERFATFATIDFTNRHHADFAQQAIRTLRDDLRQFGVVGIGETHDKGSGLFGFAARPDSRPAIHIDDPRIMPIWHAAADLNLPVLFHVADPVEFYAPIDERNEAIVGVTNSPWYYLRGLPVQSADQMRSRLHNVLERVPELKVIAAHMESLSHDLHTLAEHLRLYPNLYVEIGGRQQRLARQPRSARRFFIEFQDRILFGIDGKQPPERYRFVFRILETDDDSFTEPGRRSNLYYLYGLDLPEVVLKKVYYANAARLMPEVKQRLVRLYPDLEFP